MKLLCRQPPCRLAPAPSCRVSSPGVEPGLRPSQGRVRIPHTPKTFRRAPRRGIEPRPAVSRTAMRSGTPAGQRDQVARPGIEPGLTASEAGVRSGTLTGRSASIPTRSRTWTRALGVPCAIRYTIGTNIPEPTTGFAPASCGVQDRRLAIRPRRQSAGVRGVEPRWAALETASSPRRTLLYRPPVLRPRASWRNNYSRSVTFQYASLMNFDQLAIRTSWSA